MKTTTFLLAIIFSLTTFGVTVAMRNGDKLEGKIISKDATNFVVKTENGQVTNKWSKMTMQSFKRVNPELYQKMTDEYNAKQKAKGLVKHGKKWIKKEEAERLKYKDITIQVCTGSRKTAYVLQPKSSLEKKIDLNRKVHKRQAYLKSNLKLTGLDDTQIYSFKIKIYNFCKKFKAKDNPERIKKAINIFQHNKSVVRWNHNQLWVRSLSNTDELSFMTAKKEFFFTESFSITNKSNFDMVFKTKPYNQVRDVTKIDEKVITDRRFKSTTTYSGLESEFYLVRIYLDDKMVYEEFEHRKPDLFLIKKY